jgi:hypothetical protein
MCNFSFKEKNFSLNKKVGQVFKVDENKKYQHILFKVENLTEDTSYNLRVMKKRITNNFMYLKTIYI